MILLLYTSAYNKKRLGFTLIELSIVLVIIGLLIGGVLVGRDLIRAAEMRGIITDIERINTAINVFKGKYNALPGDMPNATSFWSADSNCPDTAYTTIPHTETCDGNGNGFIGKYDGLPWAESYEWFRAVQQLANAELIPGSYNGISGNGSNPNHVEAQPGINVPESRIKGAGYQIMDYSNTVALYPAASFPGAYGNSIQFGNPDGATTLYRPAITALDAQSIDSKMDDGLPATGIVRTFTPSSLPNCATSATPAISRYNGLGNGIACSLIFSLQ